MQSLLACALLLQALSPAAAGAAPRPLVRTGASCVSWYDSLEPTRNNNYTYRNVRWYGAKGDGITDDTAAFQTALTYNRSPLFSLSTPLVLYVPPGDYVVKSTLTLFFLTHMVGNSLCPPRLVVPPGTLRAPMSFVLSGDTSYDGEHDDEFYRGVRHIDIVLGAGNTGGCGVHWAVSQATFLRDMVIDLGPDGQYGIFDENGRLVLSPPLLPLPPLRAAPHPSRSRAPLPPPPPLLPSSGGFARLVLSPPLHTLLHPSTPL